MSGSDVGSNERIPMSFPEGSSFRDSGDAVRNADILEEYAAQLNDSSLEDIINRGKNIVPPEHKGEEEKTKETKEENPTTTEAERPVKEPTAAARRGKKPAVELPSVLRARIKEKERKKQEEKVEPAKKEEQAPPPSVSGNAAPANAEEDHEEDKTPTASPPSDPADAQWEDAVDVASTASRQMDEGHLYGGEAPLLSIASSHAVDVRKDIEALGQRVDKASLTQEALMATLARLQKSMEEVKVSNNHFSTDLVSRIRALERKFEHDKPQFQSAKHVSNVVAPSGSVPPAPPTAEPSTASPSTGGGMSFADMVASYDDDSD